MTVQVGLCRTRSEIPKTGFLASRLICLHVYMCTKQRIRLTDQPHNIMVVIAKDTFSFDTAHHMISVLFQSIYDRIHQENLSVSCIHLEPHFHIAKLGYGGVHLFFLFLLQNIDCGYSLEPTLPSTRWF